MGKQLDLGFIAAAPAGFLLTAVPSSISERGLAGRPLARLAGVRLLRSWPVSDSAPMAGRRERQLAGNSED